MDAWAKLILGLTVSIMFLVGLAFGLFMGAIMIPH